VAAAEGGTSVSAARDSKGKNRAECVGKHCGSVETLPSLTASVRNGRLRNQDKDSIPQSGIVTLRGEVGAVGFIRWVQTYLAVREEFSPLSLPLPVF